MTLPWPLPIPQTGTLKIGGNPVTGVYVGSTSAAKVYLGTTVLWTAPSPPPPLPPDPEPEPEPDPGSPPPLVPPPPTWTSISPSSGPGGTVVTISGRDFIAGTQAMVNDVVYWPTSLTSTSLRFTIPTLPYDGVWPVTVFNANGSCWGTFTYATVPPPFTPYSVTSASNLSVPAGCTGCYVTLIGGGGNGGGGYSTSVGPCGGGGGGGGGQVFRSYIPKNKLGSTYTVAAGGVGAESVFYSGSVSLWVGGGSDGTSAQNVQPGVGGGGGGVSITSNGASISSAVGGKGGDGGNYSSGQGATGGGGGGGGGADVIFMYSAGSAEYPGGPGGDASRDGDPGVSAFSYGGGGGGGGARKSTIGLPHMMSNGGQGYPGYAMVEWI